MGEGGGAPRAAVGGARVAVGGGAGGEGQAAGRLLGEGVWEGGVLGHVWLRLVQRVPETRQHGQLGVKLAVPRHQHRRQNCGKHKR